MAENSTGSLSTPPEHIIDFSLNTVIASMDCLPKSGIVDDQDHAHEIAVLEKPHMDKAMGRLALAEQRHKDFHRDANGPNFMPLFAPLQLIREGREVKKAQRAIVAAYQASLEASIQ